MSPICPDYLTIGLEAQYAEILQQHLAENQLLNPSLKIQAVSFRPWKGNCVGVLLTPWSMQLMLVPNEGDGWAELQEGTFKSFDFPSGSVEFVLEDSKDLGKIFVCPLYSPIFDIQDQETAVEIAKMVMDSLMDESKEDKDVFVSHETISELYSAHQFI